MGIWQVEGETGKGLKWEGLGRRNEWQDCWNTRFQRETESLSGSGRPPSDLSGCSSVSFLCWPLVSCCPSRAGVCQGSGPAAFSSHSPGPLLQTWGPELLPVGAHMCFQLKPRLLSCTQMAPVPPALYLGEWGPHPPSHLSQRIVWNASSIHSRWRVKWHSKLLVPFTKIENKRKGAGLKFCLHFTSWATLSKLIYFLTCKSGFQDCHMAHKVVIWIKQ